MRFIILILLFSSFYSENWGSFKTSKTPVYKGQNKKYSYTDELSMNYKILNEFGQKHMTDMSQSISTRQLSNASSLYKMTAKNVVFIGTDDSGVGAGVIIGKNEIVTNFHVVKGFETVYIVKYNPKTTSLNQIDDTDVLVGEVFAVDTDRDLAMIKTTNQFTSKASMGTNWKINIADDVYAIGHPAGLWGFTYGVISSLPTPKQWYYSEHEKHEANCIQTQTPINPGNSGGPLFNDRGQLVGINTFTSVESEGLNFAVRLDEVKDFIGKARTGQYPHGKEWVPKWEKVSGDSWRSISWLEGIDVLWGLDSDFDGEYDKWEGVIGDNEFPSIRFGDLTGDGLPNWMHYVADGIYYLDSDYDGIPDTIGIDNDNDWEPDEFKPIES